MQGIYMSANSRQHYTAYILFICFSDLNNAPLQSLITEQGYKITMTEHDLNGPERFAADGLANQEQCDMLIQLATVTQSPYFTLYMTPQISPHKINQIVHNVPSCKDLYLSSSEI